jgi:predicted MFS family arabinose efflux permease
MRANRHILLFVLAVCLLSCAGGIFETTSNNYYSDTFGISAEQRGFMVAVMAGALFFATEAALGIAAAGMVSLGLVGLALFAHSSDQYGSMIAFLVVWSAGTHLMMPVTQGLALALAEGRSEGAKLGALASLRALATVAGCAIVWIYFGRFEGRFPVTFITAGAIAALAAAMFVALARTMPPIHHGPRPKLVLKKRYRLFYALSVLFGARKQVFITFGPWVIIRIFHQGPDTIAKLWIVSTLLMMGLMPLVGRLIDRFGERLVLTADALMLLCVCLTYAFAQDILPAGPAFLLVCAAYVTDNMLFGVQMARATYLSKIAEDRRDVSGTIGLGVSIDHAVSIPVAMLGGELWVATGGHRPVFLAAAVIAVVTFATCRFIRVPARAEPATA